MSAVIARLGHTDQLTLCDAGLPIPAETQRIDLALTQGVPTFLQVFAAVTQEMQVESAIGGRDRETESAAPRGTVG